MGKECCWREEEEEERANYFPCSARPSPLKWAKLFGGSRPFCFFFLPWPFIFTREEVVIQEEEAGAKKEETLILLFLSLSKKQAKREKCCRCGFHLRMNIFLCSQLSTLNYIRMALKKPKSFVCALVLDCGKCFGSNSMYRGSVLFRKAWEK